MSLTDSEMIDNLLGRVGGNSKFEDQQLIYLNDQNQGSYTNPIKFNTLTWIDDWMAYPKAYINIPLRAVGTGTTANFNTGGAAARLIDVDANGDISNTYPLRAKVTTKNGIYSLVNSLNIKVNGYTIQNSSDLHLMNNIKALTKWSKDYAESSGVLHHFAKDTVAVNNSNNKGFLDRCELTNYAATITQAGANGECTYTADFSVNIHLSVISDFFDQLGMPLKNANIDIVLGLNGLDKGSGAGQDWDCLAIDAALKTALGANDMKLQIGNQWERVCKLYCPRVTFSASDALELDITLSNPDGYQKTIVWDDCQVVKNTQLDNSENLSMVLSPSIRRPLQVWSYFLPKPAGASQIKVQTVPYPFISNLGVKSHLAPAATPTGVAITNANLRVDSKKLYDENIDSQAQFYEMLRDQTLSGADDKQTGSLISYKEFHELYQFYCFDLTRTAYKITDKPVALEFMAKKLNAANLTELFHVIVLETVTVFNFVAGNVAVTSVGAQ